MQFPAICRAMMIAAIVASTLVGCSGSGTTVDNGPGDAPPITKENVKNLTDSVTAGAGAGGMKSPGVTPKR
jgi:hypothetical protein